MQTELLNQDFTIAVCMRHTARPTDFRCNHLYLNVGDMCVVDTEHGPSLGRVARARMRAKGRICCHRLRNVIRKATPSDLKILERIREKEEKVSRIARRKIKENELKMKLSNVEVTYDEKRAIVFFTADSRIDFRDMVKSLAAETNIKIEMRQMGTRDEAKMLGGSGICGFMLCCSAFLSEFSPVSIKMAKDQGLSLNPSKISGVCGRLMCCLNFENEFYREMQKIVPRIGRMVMTPEGKGKIINSNYLKARVTVVLEDEKRKTFEAREVSLLLPENQVKKEKKKKDKKRKDENTNGRKEKPRDSNAAPDS